MKGSRTVGAVILAAGASHRYGTPKQLVLIGGQRLVDVVIDLAAAAELAPIVVVAPVWLSHRGDLDAGRLRWARNPFPERGIGLSLRLGFGELPDEVEAAVIFLGDQPQIPAATIGAILAARGERPVVACQASGVLAPPLLIERSHFRLVHDVTGDIGLREILRAHPDLVRPVPIARHPPDIDTPEDLGRILGP